MKRPMVYKKSFQNLNAGFDVQIYYKIEADALFEEIETLHASILDKIHLTQIAASGFSNSECLEEIQKLLGEK